VPTDPAPVTLADVVHRSVAACELGPYDERVDDLLARFEDDDEPVTGDDDLALRLDEACGAIDPDWEETPLAIARAVVLYLAYRRDELDADPATLLRLAVRSEFDGEPPPPLAEWLSAAGVAA
jgi:hypothetical protein